MEIHVRGSMSRKMELLVREESEKTFFKDDLSQVWVLLEVLRQEFHYGGNVHLEIRVY